MFRLGIDVGGTFTDFTLYDEAAQRLQVFKCLTTPDDPSRAVLAGITSLLGAERGLEQVSQLVHATTLATNVLLERKGHGVALLTTRGFRDVLEIRRQKRHELYDHFIDTPTPLVPRWLIREITERLQYDGDVLTPVDADEVRAAVHDLAQQGVRSIAVCLLHAYANAAHEQQIGALIAETAPDMLRSLSSEVCPKFREYERTSTTVANAYVMPQVHAYLGTLRRELRARGLAPELYIMQSNGGVAAAETMRRQPVRMIESGPAAGTIMAAYLGRQLALPDLMSFDMGGTTAKVCLIEAGTPTVTGEFEVDRVQMKAGSGLPLSIPSVDLNEIGAGGGSIARTRLGMITVGPDSAGAAPGPMCYGLGGAEPTVTDADLVLGYLNPAYFLGGTMRLDPEAAWGGIEAHIALPLGLDVVRAAWGIYQTVNANMARAARMMTIERGKDPRRFAFVAFGGAGPVHGIRLARELGMTRIVLPAAAGVASAVGLLTAAMAFDLERTAVTRLDSDAVEAANHLFGTMEQTGRRLVAEAAADAPCALTRTAGMRYVGQGHELDVVVPGGTWNIATLDAVRRRFESVYAETYGYSDAQEAVEIVTWKVNAAAPPPVLALPVPTAVGTEVAQACKGMRPAYFPECGGFVECPVYDRYLLASGMTLEGPAVIEERESTALILPGDTGHVDRFGNVLITVSSAAKGI
jgi:N-methylhydantoinase A